MKILLVHAFMCCCLFSVAQNFTGTWKGVITRDFGDKITADTIVIELIQTGNKLSGNSLIYFSGEEYIRAEIEGEYIPATSTIKLTETSIIETNMVDRGEVFYLDRYIFSMDANNTNLLNGKSISTTKRQIYSRSKLQLTRL